MEIITRFVSEELIHALGWTVLHSLWQAVGVALLLAGAMLALRKHTAQVRYTAAFVALMLIFGMSLFTFFDQLHLAKENAETDAITRIYSENGDLFSVYYMEGNHNLLSRFAEYFNEHMPLIVTVWFLGVAFFVLRLLGGLAYVQRLKTTYTSHIPEKWQYLLEDLAAQIPVKRSVALLESALVKVPMVIGHFKPVILLPIGAVNGLTPAQVEAILAHELAHIARHDYILHILQSAIEAFFYFNPAIWWISAIIRTEREHCCDDVAVAICGNQLTYAKALVALQEMSIATPNLAMTFASNKNQLLKRIQRILNQPQNKSDIMEKLTATCLLLAVLVGLSVSAARPYQDFSKSPNISFEPDVMPVTDAIEPDYNYDFNYDQALAAVDTLPKGKRNGTFSYDDGEKRVEAKIVDNEITHLKIDGKEIPKSEISQYEEMVEELMSNVPEPPLPPMPPSAAPPAPSALPAPPAPPAPPTPRAWHNGSDNKVTKTKDKDGNTIITIENDNGSSANLEIKKDGKVYMNGKELKEGEAASFFGNVDPEVWEMNEKALRMQQEQMAKVEADWSRQQDAWRQSEAKFREQERALQRQAEEMNRKSAALAQSAPAAFGSAFAFPSDDPNWEGNGTYVVEAVGNDNIRKTLEKELLKDGLIKNTNNYKFELSAKSVKVNGKELSEASAKKYIELYEKTADFKMRTNSRYTISRRAAE